MPEQWPTYTEKQHNLDFRMHPFMEITENIKYFAAMATKKREI